MVAVRTEVGPSRSSRKSWIRNHHTHRRHQPEREGARHSSSYLCEKLRRRCTEEKCKSIVRVHDGHRTSFGIERDTKKAHGPTNGRKSAATEAHATSVGSDARRRGGGRNVSAKVVSGVRARLRKALGVAVYVGIDEPDASIVVKSAGSC